MIDLFGATSLQVIGLVVVYGILSPSLVGIALWLYWRVFNYFLRLIGVKAELIQWMFTDNHRQLWWRKLWKR